MAAMSEILLRFHDLKTFEDLVAVVRELASEGETFLHFDVRPPFADTPQDWEARLEAVFTSPIESTRR